MTDRAREVERERLFLQSLKEHFDAPAPEPTNAEVAAILRCARSGGSQPVLRVVGHDDASPFIRRSSASGRLRWWWAALPVAAAAAAVTVWASLAEDDAPLMAQAVTPLPGDATEQGTAASVVDEVPKARSELVLSAGEVLVDGVPVELAQSPLSQGQRVATGKGRACLTVDPSVDVCLADDSEVAIGSLVRSDLALEVVRGKVVAQLSKLPPDHVFAMTASGLRAEAIGTVFEVAHTPEQQATVTVLAGTVGVGWGTRAAFRLPEHTRVKVDLPSARAHENETVSRVEETAVRAHLAYAPWWEPTEVGLLEVVDSGQAELGAAPVEVSIDGEAPLPLPLRVLMPLGEHEVVVMGQNPEEPRKYTVVSSASGAARLDLARAETTANETAKRMASERTSSAAELLRLAREQRSRGQAAAALGTYRELRRAHPSSPEAHTVLVPMGKLQLSVGQATNALASFERYLAAGGPLAPEALGGKIAALRALGRRAGEKAAIGTYLQQYPQGFAAPQLRARLAELRD